MIMDTHENRFNVLAEVAKAEANINASLSILDLGQSVKVGNSILGNSKENKDRDKSTGVRIWVKNLYFLFGMVGPETLLEWMKESSTADAIKSCEIALSKIKKTVAYRENFIKSFDRNFMAQDYLDECTPTGDVHYRILYTFDQSKGIYTSHRKTVSELDGDFWDKNTLWFDYYGPEENDCGLIPYLDY